MAPPMPLFEEWYCRHDLMWWGSWPNHVKGWWNRSQKEKNVLFVYFEDMKRDLPATIRQVAAFLGMKPLTRRRSRKRSRRNAVSLTCRSTRKPSRCTRPISWPTSAELFVRGSADRHLDVPEDARKRVGEWAEKEMEGSTFPMRTDLPAVDHRCVLLFVFFALSYDVIFTHSQSVTWGTPVVILPRRDQVIAVERETPHPPRHHDFTQIDSLRPRRTGRTPCAISSPRPVLTQSRPGVVAQTQPFEVRFLPGELERRPGRLPPGPAAGSPAPGFASPPSLPGFEAFGERSS